MFLQKKTIKCILSSTKYKKRNTIYGMWHALAQGFGTLFLRKYPSISSHPSTNSVQQEFLILFYIP